MDTMNIGLTEILSFAALIVSVFSMLYAKSKVILQREIILMIIALIYLNLIWHIEKH
jgi:hypothetical protein